MTPEHDGGPDGGPAFPMAALEAYHQSWPGMSLRDWFAGQALSGLCGCDDRRTFHPNYKADATWCYDWADAMLQARKATAPQTGKE